MRQYLCLLSLSYCLPIGCSSSQQKSSDLDFKTTVSSPEIAPESSTFKSKPEELAAQDILNWQNLYKVNPSSEDIKKLRTKIDQIPSTFETRLQKARNVLAMGYRDDARTLYANLLRESPENIDVLIDSAHMFLGEGNLERAFDYINTSKRILEKTERPARPLVQRYRYALALAYLQAKNHKKSAEILTDLIDQEPRFQPAYMALSQSYIQLRKYELAEFVSKRGLDVDDRNAALLNILGVIALKRGKFEDARVWIQRSLEASPDYAPALINRSHLAMRRREFVTAENDLMKAIELDPSNLEAQLALGMLLKKSGRSHSAKIAFEKAIGIDPQNAFARYHLGQLLAQEFKDTTSALQMFYDVLQSKDHDLELKDLAKAQIQSIRDSRLYER